MSCFSYIFVAFSLSFCPLASCDVVAVNFCHFGTEPAAKKYICINLLAYKMVF